MRCMCTFFRKCEGSLLWECDVVWYTECMKKKNIHWSFLMSVFLFVGCGQEEVLVVKDSVQEETAAPVEEVEVKEKINPSISGENLVITDRLVDWGFAPASRGSAEIDTLIIHSVYNPFVEKGKHDLSEIVDIFKGYNVAPHYIITRDGQIHRTVADKDIAYHAGRSRTPDGRTNLNTFSLGVELVNSLDDTYTEMQYSSLRALIEALNAQYDLAYVLGHDEVEVEDPWNFDWEQVNEFRHESR